MFKTLRDAWAIPDLRKKILFTIFMLVVFRFGSMIPVPGLTAEGMRAFMGADSTGMGLFALLDTFTGGSFSKATIFAMGITPYINSSIIMQLLCVAIPALERLSKEGEEGRKKINSITRYVTVALALLQAIGLCATLNSYPDVINNPGFVSYAVIVLSFTAGTAFVMWLGEQITDKGIGNGMSLLIFAGIVSGGPQLIATLYNQFLAELSVTNTILLLVILAVFLFILGFVVFMNNAERRIPVQYAKRVVGRKMYGGQSTNIPIKVAMAGVIPIIFASSIMAFPATIAQIAGGIPTEGFWGGFFRVFAADSWVYAVVYFLLIIFFTYFYTAMQFNPVEMANNIKKNGGFIPGIRPGKPTSDYIAKVINRIVIVGALFLGVLAVMPMAFSSVMPTIAIGGTSLLIVEGVALETVKQIESMMLMRHYKGFLE